MEHNDIYISRFSAWAPGIENADEWEEWAQGKREMSCVSESPKINFTDPMFRRRLSQVSKMTIQVVHDILPVKEETKMLFLSFRGELSGQFKTNKTQFENGYSLPAAFSYSVFNAPAALASMAFGLKGGYTAVYPINNSIKAGLLAAAAMLKTGSEDELVFVYADENVKEEYSSLLREPLPPFAFSLLLSRKPCESCLLPEQLQDYLTEKKEICPKDFLRLLYLNKNNT